MPDKSSSTHTRFDRAGSFTWPFGWAAALCLLAELPACRTTTVADPRVERAEAFARVGSWQSAAALWTSIYQSSGGRDARAGVAAARALVDGERFSAARTRLSDVVARDLISSTPMRAEVQELLGRAAEGLGASAEAMERYEAALGLDADRPIALGRLGGLLLDSGSPERGVELLQRSLELDPTGVDMARRLGLGAARAGRLDAAQSALERADKAGVLSLEELRGMVTSFGDDRRVIPWLVRLVERDPQDTAALRHLGEAYAASGRSALALEALARAAECDPGDVPTLLVYARALHGSGDVDAASAILDHAESLELEAVESRGLVELRREWEAARAKTDAQAAQAADGA